MLLVLTSGRWYPLTLDDIAGAYLDQHLRQGLLLEPAQVKGFDLGPHVTLQASATCMQSNQSTRWSSILTHSCRESRLPAGVSDTAVKVRVNVMRMGGSAARLHQGLTLGRSILHDRCRKPLTR